MDRLQEADSGSAQQRPAHCGAAGRTRPLFILERSSWGAWQGLGCLPPMCRLAGHSLQSRQPQVEARQSLRDPPDGESDSSPNQSISYRVSSNFCYFPNIREACGTYSCFCQCFALNKYLRNLLLHFGNRIVAIGGQNGVKA